MAFTEGTGKSLAVTCVYGTVTPDGWKQIVIAETGAPVTATIDHTAAADAAYVEMADPLGGQGSATATVTMDGYWSIYDKNDVMLTSLTIDASALLEIRFGANTTGIWEWTSTATRYAGISMGAAFAEVQPFKATWSVDASAGVWQDSTAP